MNQKSLFTRDESVKEDLTVADLIELNNGNDLGRFSDQTEDEFNDMIWGCPEKYDSFHIHGLGGFECIANWGTYFDGRTVGFVLHHFASNKNFMFSGRYSSWDSTEWEISEAEEATVTVTKWVPKS